MADLSVIAIDVVKQAIAAGVVAGLAWFGGPLKWLVHNRRLKRLLVSERRFLLVFNPTAIKAKVITFSSDGAIGEGRNENEHTWRISRGKLEIYAADAKIYSRFKHDKGSGQLKHTNDTDTRSIPNQYFEPSLVRIYATEAQSEVSVDGPRAVGEARR